MADLDFGGNLIFKMALLAIAPGKLVKLWGIILVYKQQNTLTCADYRHILA